MFFIKPICYLFLCVGFFLGALWCSTLGCLWAGFKTGNDEIAERFSSN